MRSITTQSEQYLAPREASAAPQCDACGEAGPVRRHAMLNSSFCVACTEIASDVAGLASGPSIGTHQ